MEVSFLKDAIEKIAGMAYPHFYKDEDSRQLYYDRGGDYEPVEPPLYVTKQLRLSSLDALVKVVKTECQAVLRDYRAGVYYISVPSPTQVEVYSTPRRDLRSQRRELCVAEAVDIPGFRDRTYEYEAAIIALRSRFAPSEDQAYVLDLMGHLVSEQTVQTEDDGITQRVQVNAGVQMTRITQVKPIVRLRPYRTFQEVFQPESEFLIRLDGNRNLTISEADGGMWRLEARKTIKSYLESAFVDEIGRGDVIVML